MYSGTVLLRDKPHYYNVSRIRMQAANSDFEKMTSKSLPNKLMCHPVFLYIAYYTVTYSTLDDKKTKRHFWLRLLSLTRLSG